MSRDKIFPATSMPDNDWWHALWPDPARVLHDVGVTADMRSVDLCCGDGYFTRPMCELTSQVYGLDLDADLLGQTEAVCDTHSNFQSLLGDAHDLPQLVEGLVDFVFMANTFHGVPEPLRLSMAIYQTLSESGRFAVINWYRRPRSETTVLNQPRGPSEELRMQPEDVQQVVEPAGFILEKVVDVGPYHYGAVFIKSDKRQGLPMGSSDGSKVQAQLVTLYTKLAEMPDSEFGWSKGKANARQLGYSPLWLDQLPEVVWESSAAVGNPFKLGEIAPGQTVVDIGCGAGADACVAALLVGSTGSVIGVDCTPAMIDKARNNAQHAALDNIEFREADIANLAIADNSVDVVISNGAINLSESKDKVFQELYRILKPGGHLQIADMVREAEACSSSGSEVGSWADCVQGTLLPDQLLGIITDAGFVDVELVEFTGYRTSVSTNGALIRALRP